MTELKFKNLLSKCRCCFQLLKKNSTKIQISEKEQSDFLNLTQIELKLESSKYSEFLCQSCSDELKKFSSFRDNAISLQNQMYEYVTSLELNNETNTKTDEKIKDSEFLESQNLISPHQEDDQNSSRSRRSRQIINCKHCQKSFSCSSTLRLHEISKHSTSSDGNYCKLCEINFLTHHEYKRHFKSVHVPSISCQHCSKPFVSEESLRSHIRQFHDSTKNIKCNQIKCNAIFNSNNKMEEHFKLKHTKIDEKIFICDLCGVSYSRKDRLKDHLLSHHIEKVKSYKCKFCDFSTHRETYLGVHVRLHTEEPKYSCTICEKTFITEVVLRAHIKNVHEKTREVLLCWICNTECSSEAVIERHMKSCHSNEIPGFECEHCQKTFYTEIVMMRHIQNQHFQSVQCTFENCDKMFFNNKRMNAHYRQVHMKINTNQENLCSICGKSFTHQKNLKSHMQIHSENRRIFTCQFCGKELTSSHGLSLHLQRHAKSEPDLECDECGKKFFLPGDLKAHKTQNHGDKPVCELCGKELLNQFSLKVHLLGVHNQGEGQFPCKLCSFVFKTSVALRKHNDRKHSERKPCDICGKTFATREQLIKHHKSNHLNMKYSCIYPGCFKKYSFKHGLKKHLKTHPINTEEWNEYNQLVRDLKPTETLDFIDEIE